MICGYDGKTAWWFNRAQLSEPQILPAEEALIFTRYADFGDLFVDYEQKGQKIEYIGIEDVDGQKAYKLKITSQNGIIRYVYLDDKNFLAVKESYRSKNEKDFGMEVIFKDYRAIDGVMFPFFHDITGDEDRQKHEIPENTSCLLFTRVQIVQRLDFLPYAANSSRITCRRVSSSSMHYTVHSQ